MLKFQALESIQGHMGSTWGQPAPPHQVELKGGLEGGLGGSTSATPSDVLSARHVRLAAASAACLPLGMAYDGEQGTCEPEELFNNCKGLMLAGHSRHSLLFHSETLVTCTHTTQQHQMTAQNKSTHILGRCTAYDSTVASS